MSRLAAIGLLFLTALLWSTGGLLIKSVDWTPLGIAGARSAIAVVLLWGLGRPLRFTWSPTQLGGAVAYAGTVILFVTANKLTTAANAILLQYTAPVYVALFGAWFLGERAKRSDWLTIVLAFLGMALFFVDDLSLGNVWGNLVALASGICFAWTALFLRRQKEGSPLGSVVLGNILTVLVCLPFAGMPHLEPAGWGALVVLGLGQLGLSYYLYAKAIRHVTAIEAILIPVVEPILNPVWVFLILGERPGPWALVGGAVILTSVVGRSLLPALRIWK